MEKKIRHLEMIENIITRMGSNSFHLKGWAITLISIIGALTLKEDDRCILITVAIPILAFWALDAYYLQLERKYKELYRLVSAKSEEEIDFSMDFSLVKDKRTGYLKCLASRTAIFFYPVLMLSLLVLAFICGRL